MTDKQMQLWAWLCRQGPKTVLATLANAQIDADSFFSEVAGMKHHLEKTTSRKLKAAKPLEELGKIHELRFDRMKKIKKAKKAKKARAIELQFWVIVGLREKGASWNEIVSYLSRYNKLKITREYLSKTMLVLADKYIKDHENT